MIEVGSMQHATTILTRAVVFAPDVPVGNIKSFGPVGPRYEIGDRVRRLDDGDWLIPLTLIETGGKAEYRLSRLLDDPEAV